MTTLHINIAYDLGKDSYTFDTDVKQERISEVLTDFLQMQIGRGKDDTPPAERDVYHIRIKLDLSEDRFDVEHDCGNLGLRDGLLLNALKHLPE
jgi:hypothetical protein